jgi:chromate transporter
MSEGAHPQKSSLLELARVFLGLGTLAFGGPAAHIAMMEREFVRQRAWFTHEEFVDMIGAANLIPGPSSTEVAIFVGLRRAGILGLVLAGVCFILPAALLVTLIAWAYVRFGQLPSFHSALYGVKPVVVAIIAQAIALLAIKVMDAWPKRLALAACACLAWLGASAIILLVGGGLLLGANALRTERSFRSAAPLATLVAGVAAIAVVPLIVVALQRGPTAATPVAVFIYFLKLGSVLYGSGYVLLAFLDRDLVAGLHWLTRGQMLDAVAVGQFTPGPVFTTATFVGFVLAGPMGAVAGTVGIFLPTFLFVAIAGRMLPRLRAAPVSAGFLDGVNAAALALMGFVLVRLAIDAVRDVPSAAIATLSLVVLLRFRVNSPWLILVGALIGIGIRLAAR